MRTVLALVGVAAVAVVVWFIRGRSDAPLLEAKNTEIAALQESVRTSTQLADSRSELIKTIEDKLKSAEDLVAKDQAQIDAIQATLKRTQDADQTIIASLKADNEADIAALKRDIESKDEEIAQLNEKLVQTIADYEAKLNSARSQIAQAPADGEKIYPKDNGFDAQDLGSGFFSYAVFGPAKNPNNVAFPPPVPNQTAWKFGDGNSGVAANGCGYYVTGATNGDSDGAKSTNGQAASLEYAGSWISQSIKLPAGKFSISFDYEGRMNYMPANVIAVSINGTEVFRDAPTCCDHFEHVTTQTFTFAHAGNRELKFLGCGSKGNASSYPSTFIDNVVINVLDSKKHPTKHAEDDSDDKTPDVELAKKK